MGMTPAETERVERIERVLAEWSGAGTLAMLDTKNVSIYGSILNQNEALNALIAAGASANRDDDKAVVAAALRKAADALEA